MNMQKRTIYVMIVSSIVCIIIYSICLFVWRPNSGTNEYLINIFVSNIILGLLGSSVISGIVAFIAYLQNRKDTLEKYIFKYHELIAHCLKYCDIDDHLKKVEWFNQYVNLVRDLETIWADIGFLIDLNKNRLFLKKVVDYYNDFIWLTENHYRLLGENIAEAAKKILSKEIDKIVIDETITKQGGMTHKVRHNRFTYNMAYISNSINEIYRDRKIFAKYIFDKSLVTREVFVFLDEKLEKYVEKMVDIINKTGKANIILDVPEKVCKELQKANYISSYSTGDTKRREVNCQLILAHYFELKKKCV